MYFYAARQPILNVEKELYAYELLFRDGVDNVFPEIDGDLATSRIVEGAQINFGLQDLTDNKPAFINFTLDTIAKKYPTMMAPESLVVEILETVQPGKRLLAEVQKLKELGYTLALDDYEHKPVWRHFFPYIDLIKVDLRETERDQVEVIVKDLASYPKIALLAEKVETLEEFEWCKSLGFKYFQGFFFSKPASFLRQAQVLSTPTLPTAFIVREMNGNGSQALHLATCVHGTISWAGLLD